MALTQEQWFQKLKGFVPEWWFEQERYNVAVFQAMAKMLSQVQTDAESYVRETFIAQSTAPVLDAHGDERSLDRLTGESDSAYSLRVRKFINQSNKSALKAIVDAILSFGECEIREGGVDLCFANRSSFYSRDEFLTERHYNYFMIVVDRQAPPTLSFASRSYFASRGAYVGNGETQSAVYESVIEAVNKAKALGTLYQIVER